MKTATKHRRIKYRGGNKTLKKKFVRLNCSPDNEDNSHTCYTDNDLVKMKSIWNSRHPDDKLTSKSPKKIWETLKYYYTNICNKESCWVKQMVKTPTMREELLDSFAPEAPHTWDKNPNEWLTSLDILSVMNQYEKKYKCFEFIGPSPIDFDTYETNGKCVWPELCEFSVESQLKRNKPKIGIIFNTDPHDKGGEHWISLFIDVKKGRVIFFDSVGSKCPPEIMNLVNRIINEGKRLSQPIHFVFDQNHPVEHQYGNTECGIYSLYFIVQMLKDKISARYLKTHILSDKYIEKFRNIYFNREL